MGKGARTRRKREEAQVDHCPDCGEKGDYEGRVLVGGRGTYTCPDPECGTRWQNRDEKPDTSKATPIRMPAPDG